MSSGSQAKLSSGKRGKETDLIISSTRLLVQTGVKDPADIEWLAELFRPTLLVLDATGKLVRNGPTGGSLSDVEAGYTVAGGTDQVAIDAFAAGMLNIEPPQFVRAAANRGLGNPNWQELVRAGGT